MSLLQVFLPNEWSDTPPLSWRLTDGVTTRMGESPLESLPRGADIELILPASRVLLTRIKLPPGNTQKLGEIVSYAVEDKLLCDPDAIHAAVGPRNAEGMATAAIVDRSWITNVRDRFSAAGQRPIRAFSELATTPFTPGAWNLVWHGDHGWLRTGEDQGLVADASGAGAPLSLLLAVQEARAANTLPDCILVHAANGQALPDLSRWESELELSVKAGPDWSWHDIDAPVKRGVNLLQGAFAPARSPAELLARFRLPAMLAAGIASLYILGGVADWGWLTWQKRSLETQMREMFKTAFPGALNIPNPPRQMQQNLADLKRVHGEADASDFIPLLASALPAITAAGGAPQAMQYERGKLQLDLKLSQPQSPDALNQQLSSTGVQAKVESVNPTPGGVVARIIITGAERLL